MSDREEKLIDHLTRARDIVTELARFISVEEKDPVKREDLYYRLIESLDFSYEWHAKAGSRTLGALYKELTEGWWGDADDEKKDDRYE